MIFTKGEERGAFYFREKTCRWKGKLGIVVILNLFSFVDFFLACAYLSFIFPFFSFIKKELDKIDRD